MPETTQPRDSDAILGGQTPPPIAGAVLGGLEGANQRLESEVVAARLSALQEAFQYGEQGIELAVQALSDQSEQVKRLACRLLRQGNERGKQALLDHQPLSYFTTLADWRWETYNPQVGITDPANNAYVIRMEYFYSVWRMGNDREAWNNRTGGTLYDLSTFEALLKDPKLDELQVLIFQIDSSGCVGEHAFGVALEAICDARSHMPNLKALFVGDSEGDRTTKFKKSKVRVFDIRPFLEAFPKLEVLQIFGYFADEEFDGFTLECAGLRHEHLKSLIIETSDIARVNIEQICSMDLPELEYFELWFGRRYRYDSALEILSPILTTQAYPKLKYLGLCSSEEIGTLVREIINAPIMKQLAVLDLKMGTLEDAQVAPLLDAEATSHLKILNVTGNYLDDETIVRLAQQSYQLISTYQTNSGGPEFYDAAAREMTYMERQQNYRYYALYE